MPRAIGVDGGIGQTSLSIDAGATAVATYASHGGDCRTAGLQAFGGSLYYWTSGDSVEDKGLLRILDIATGQIALVTPPSDPMTMIAADAARGCSSGAPKLASNSMHRGPARPC